MFDTVINPVRTEYVTRTVNEYRAPTDESVRLLREMEEKARNEILKSYKLESNILKGVIHEFMDYLHDTSKIGVQFELNGHRIVSYTEFNRYDSPETKTTKLMECVASEITKELLSKVNQQQLHQLIYKSA